MMPGRGISTLSVVLAIFVVAVLTVLFLPQIIHPDGSSITQAKKDIELLYGALAEYKGDNGFYPSENQGLKALVEEPTTAPVPRNYSSKAYLSAIPRDPWENAYQYENNNGVIRVYSFGPNGPNSNSIIDRNTQ